MAGGAVRCGDMGWARVSCGSRFRPLSELQFHLRKPEPRTHHCHSNSLHIHTQKIRYIDKCVRSNSIRDLRKMWPLVAGAFIGTEEIIANSYNHFTYGPEPPLPLRHTCPSSDYGVIGPWVVLGGRGGKPNPHARIPWLPPLIGYK